MYNIDKSTDEAIGRLRKLIAKYMKYANKELFGMGHIGNYNINIERLDIDKIHAKLNVVLSLDDWKKIFSIIDNGEIKFWQSNIPVLQIDNGIDDPDDLCKTVREQIIYVESKTIDELGTRETVIYDTNHIEIGNTIPTETFGKK